MADEPINLSERFPDLRPVGSAPSMGSVNGVGTGMYGRRDFDPETGTYLKTHCVCFLFIPLIALGAYRVADGQNGGWYLIGREPLSAFARWWNRLLLVAVLVGGGAAGYSAYIGTEGYQAGVKLAKADALAADGRQGQAAELYRDLTHGPKGAEARQRISALLADDSLPAGEAAGVVRVALDLNRRGESPAADLFDRGTALAKKQATADPVGALALLEAVAPLAPDPAATLGLRREILEALVKAKPDDLDAVGRLADLYERAGQDDQARRLLEPLADKLGDTAGAAVLGRLDAADGKLDRAITLLQPYVDAKLPAVKTAEAAFRGTVEQVEREAVDRLKTGSAPGFDYQKYERVGKAEQQSMVSAYVDAAERDDPRLRAARQAVVDAAGVVPAAMDLGVVRLQRAQGLADPAARTAELERAEKTFLSVRGLAGESDAYKLTLGQVYYWLGKPADGRKLFDELLANTGRPPETVLRVAGVLREVGAITEARTLAEDAYAKATDQAVKYAAASVRAIMFTDLDDDVLWLERSNPADPQVRASLAGARGRKLVRAGKRDEAAAQFRAAIAEYAGLAENPSTLNNSAPYHLELAEVANDPAEFARGVDKLDRAIALLPTDSILLHNSVNVVTRRALADALAGAVDLVALRRPAGWDLLPFAYDDPAGKAALAAKLRTHPGVVKARAYADKLVVLAPQRHDGYDWLAQVGGWLGDTATLKAVEAKLAGATLDLGKEDAEYRDFVAGVGLDKRKQDTLDAVQRAEEALATVAARTDATRAAAVAGVVNARAAAAMFGEKIDADALVRLADTAATAAPSAGSRRTLRTALNLRAHQRLAAADPAYNAAATATARTLSLALLELVLLEGGPLGATVSADPDVTRLRTLATEQAARTPTEFGPATWVLLVTADKAAADKLAAGLKQDPTAALGRALHHRTSSPSVAGRVQEYFEQRMAGRPATLADVNADLAKWKLPALPPLR